MTDNPQGAIDSKIQDIIGEVREINSKVEKSSATFAEKEQMSKLESKFDTVMDTVEKMRASMQAPEAKEGNAEAEEKAYADALNLYLKKGNETAIAEKSLSAGVDSDGGYLLTPASNKIIDGQIFETSPVMQYASVQAISTDSFDVIVDNDEAGSANRGEQGSVSETDTPTLDKKIIPVHEYYAEPKATQKIIDDSSINIEQWLSGKVASAISRDINTDFVNGDGVGKCTGLTKSISSDIALSTADSFSATAAEVYKTGTASSFGTNDGTAADNILTFVGKLKEPYASNAILFGKRATRVELMKLQDGNGSYIFNYAGKDGLTVDGIPFVAFNDMGAYGVDDALALGVADLRSAYQVVERTGIRVLRDAFTSKGFIKFFTTKRVGGDVVNYEALKLLRLAD